MRALTLTATLAVFVVSGAEVAGAQNYNLRSYSDCRGPGIAHRTLPRGSLIETVAPRRISGKVLKVHRKPGFPEGSFKTAGRASIFNDGRTASGRHDGVSTWFYGKLGGWWLIRSPNGRIGLEQQVDNGPAGWTGRWLDLLPGATNRFGYPHSLAFPTDRGTWHGRFLGYSKPRGMKRGIQRISAIGICEFRGRVTFRVKRRGPAPRRHLPAE